MRGRLDELRERALEELRASSSLDDLEQLKVKYLGRRGSLTQFLRNIGDLPPDQRPEAGKAANILKRQIEEQFEHRLAEIEGEIRERRLACDRVDITAPGRKPPGRARHPLIQTIDETIDIFVGLGYDVAEGPEAETEEFNFKLLNFPADHPAWDLQDSFYLGEDIVLRTQTSPIQIRYMRETAPRLPVRIVGPGRVYRRDDDISHSPMFHQIEALVVDEGITMGDLRGTLMTFVRRMFGPGRDVRFRPSYFPFTEPSAEVDVSCPGCGGGGCRTCGGTGYLELLGAGMVHPNVLRNGGYDPDTVSGFAFGMGLDRICMLRYGVEDMRLLFQNDLRFLDQFSGR